MLSPLLRAIRTPSCTEAPPHAIPPQALTALTEPADAMRTILSARLAHLRVIGSLWAAGGAERALTKVRHSLRRAPLCRACSRRPLGRRAHATPGAAVAHRRWTSTSCQCWWTF